MRTYAPADPKAVLDRILEEPSLARGVVHHERIPARDAEFGDWPDWLAPGIRDGLRARGIERPYVHQAEAIEAVHGREDIVVVTPTASGKSLCYAVPILQAIANDPAARALCLFPTKALGQDQVAELSLLAREDTRYLEMRALLPFAPAIMELHERQRRMVTVVPDSIARTLAGAAEQVLAATKALDSVPARPTKILAWRAAATTLALRETLRRWYEFHAGYDPMFTWWNKAPYEKTAEAMQKYAKKRMKELGLHGHGLARINAAGCMDRCDEGPVMVVYPEEVWYTYVDEKDIDEIIDEHLVNGRIVERLRI